MFCEKCGKEIKDGDKFCPYCGAENEINKEEPSHDIPPDFSVKGAGKKKKGAVIAIAVLVIIVAIGIFKCSSKDEILRYALVRPCRVRMCFSQRELSDFQAFCEIFKGIVKVIRRIVFCRLCIVIADHR